MLGSSGEGPRALGSPEQPEKVDRAADKLQKPCRHPAPLRPLPPLLPLPP